MQPSKLMSITVPKDTFARIRKTAKKENKTISGLLREAFEFFVDFQPRIYSDKEIETFLKEDTLSHTTQKSLDTLIAAKK